jgi:hypothetical protein
VDGPLGGVEAAFVKLDSLLARPAVLSRHVDWPEGPDEAPEGRGALVTEDGALAAGEHRGVPAAAHVDAVVTDGVDATVDAMKPSLPKPVLDCARSDPKVQELCPRDDAMLLPREARDGVIALVPFGLPAASLSLGCHIDP